MSKKEINALFSKYDKDSNGIISFDEFIAACHSIILAKLMPVEAEEESDSVEHGFAASAFLAASEHGEEEEEEEIPDEIADLPADEQQQAIKKKAFTMLAIGTLLVLLFSGMNKYLQQSTIGYLYANNFLQIC